jgi:hypothetical protein
VIARLETIIRISSSITGATSVAQSTKRQSTEEFCVNTFTTNFEGKIPQTRLS